MGSIDTGRCCFNMQVAYQHNAVALMRVADSAKAWCPWCEGFCQGFLLSVGLRGFLWGVSWYLRCLEWGEGSNNILEHSYLPSKVIAQHHKLQLWTVTECLMAVADGAPSRGLGFLFVSVPGHMPNICLKFRIRQRMRHGMCREGKRKISVLVLVEKNAEWEWAST